MATVSLRLQRARLGVRTLVAVSAGATVSLLAAAQAPCAIDVGPADPSVERLGIHPGSYRCRASLAPPAPGLVPAAAALVDRDGDGNRELVIAYRGVGAGALVWRPLLDGVPQPAEATQSLDFPPVEMVAGDLDGDGRDELVLANADGAALVVLQVGRGALEPAARVATPGPPGGLAVVDLPPRDGLPELVFEIRERRQVRRFRAGGPHGALSELGLGRWTATAVQAAEAPSAAIPRLLFAGRMDRDAHPELLMRLDDGAVGVAALILAVIEVSSTSEVVDFGGAQQVGDLPGPDGLITLREAILAANNTAGADVIEFNIPTAGNDCHDGACWFTPSDGEAGPLPQILAAGGAVTFDGYTQTTNRGDTNPDGPELVLDGSGVTSARGFDFQGATNSAVIDFVVSGFDDGIWAFDADDLVVRGCYLGTAPDGEANAPNGSGIQLLGGTERAMVGDPGIHGVSPQVPNRNLISGNSGAGVVLQGVGTTDNDVRSNRIGTNRQGSAALANGSGVVVSTGAHGNRIGSTAAGTGNLISGNSSFGVELAGVGSTLVQGNTVGADLAGTVAVPNGFGVRLQQAATGNTIGGTTAAARNLISGNTNHGISIADPGTDGNLIHGNWIGLDATGAAPLGSDYGIYASEGVDTEIGSGVAGAGNVIAGNLCGVCLDGTSGFLVRGNRFGTDATGASAIAAPAFAVHLSVGSSDATEVGGAGAGEGNLFAGTVDTGVEIAGPAAAGNRVRGNTFGVSAAGTAVVGSLSTAIQVSGGATATEIGGPSLAERNWIAGAGLGLRITGAGTSGTLVRGNVFGRGPAGSGAAFANAVGIGISDGATDSIIGGAGGAANEIANSSQNGIRILDDATGGHRISRNAMFDNTWLGIDLALDGVTPNDPGDVDSGPNARVNWPLLASAINTDRKSVV